MLLGALFLNLSKDTINSSGLERWKTLLKYLYNLILSLQKEEVKKMTIVVVWKWVVKPEKREEHDHMMERYFKWIKANPIKEVKSMKVFTQMFGGIYGSYFELLEFDSLADYERVQARLLKDKEYMEMLQEWMRLIEPAELCAEVWNTVM